MSFANPLPWWGLAGVIAVAAALAWHVYRHLPASSAARRALAALRFATLLVLIVFLMRPVARIADGEPRDAVVPILVDSSRSMAIEDANGVRRIAFARELVIHRLLPALGSRFHVEVLRFGDDLTPTAPADLSATARRSDLQAALAAVRERYRGKVVAGLVLLSDGGDTSGAGERAASESAAPIYAIGMGSPRIARDREILSVTAAEAVLDDSRVDLDVSAVSHGNGTAPIELRLLQNGRPIEVRRPVPASDGTPLHEVFHVSPAHGSPTVYTIETPPLQGELVVENNARSVLVEPPSRPRRVLLVEGAPGFEHSFLKRAWAEDTGIEIDSVVRKGKNELGNDTFYIQAVRSRSDSLTTGYPAKPEDLFVYDAIVLANVDGDQLTRAQLDATRAFVGRRGGGLLVLGARSFLRQGLLDSALEEVLPLELNDRRGSAVPASGARGTNKVALTAEGEAHPMMQLSGGASETRKRWDAVPALASIAPLGGPRPGASVLAVTSGAGGAARALVAVQRFGEGRSMVFTGEAAWRWRMMLPAADRSYDTFWRQAIRWLALPAGGPIAVSVPPGASPGELLPLQIVARDARFEPLRDATVDVRVTLPDGRIERLRAGAEPDSGGEGRFVARIRPEYPGVYRITAEARKGASELGTVTASFLVGGADAEMTDPRLNLQVLQRVAFVSGGRVLAHDQTTELANLLSAGLPAATLAVRRDLWHTGWSFALILMLLGTEWIVRRRSGLR